MGWLEVMRRDPVPWLLDPVNPSVRLLTLQRIFGKPLAALQGEQQALLTWKPVYDLLRQFSPENLWGWRENPYHGSMAGTFGTLVLLAQLGLPRTEEIALACENVLHYGRTLEGRFKPPELADSMWVCYTGMALQALWHFGYGDDPRFRATLEMVEQSLAWGRETPTCAAAGGLCQWGLTKLLGALLLVPSDQRSPRLNLALERLIESLITFPYDFERRDAPWLQPTFPRYYDADLIELAFWVAQTDYRLHPAFLKLLGRMTALQNSQGQWPKLRRTFIFVVEKVNEPSRWLTLQAVQALMGTYGGNDYSAG